MSSSPPTPYGIFPWEIYEMIFEHLLIVDLRRVRQCNKLLNRLAQVILNRNTVIYGYGLSPQAETAFLLACWDTASAHRKTRLFIDVGRILSNRAIPQHAGGQVWGAGYQFIKCLGRLPNLNTVEFMAGHSSQSSQISGDAASEVQKFVGRCLSSLDQAGRFPAVLLFRGDKFPMPSSFLGTPWPLLNQGAHLSMWSNALRSIRTLDLTVQEPSKHLGITNLSDHMPALCLGQGLLPQVLATPFGDGVQHFLLNVDIGRPCALHSLEGGDRFARFDKVLPTAKTFQSLSTVALTNVHVPADDLANFLVRHPNLRQFQLVCYNCAPDQYPLFWFQGVTRVEQTCGERGLQALRLTLKRLPRGGSSHQCDLEREEDIWWDISGPQQLRALTTTIQGLDD